MRQNAALCDNGLKADIQNSLANNIRSWHSTKGWNSIRGWAEKELVRSKVSSSIYPYTKALCILKVAFQILGRTFYKNTKKSSLYSHS